MRNTKSHNVSPVSGISLLQYRMGGNVGLSIYTFHNTEMKAGVNEARLPRFSSPERVACWKPKATKSQCVQRVLLVIKLWAQYLFPYVLNSFFHLIKAVLWLLSFKNGGILDNRQERQELKVFIYVMKMRNSWLFIILKHFKFQIKSNQIKFEGSLRLSLI